MPHYFFGDKQSQVFPDRDRNRWQTQESLITIDPFKTIAQLHKFNTILFPHQIHGTKGIIVTNKNNTTDYHKSFIHDADWLLTNAPGLAIGILTADCVPLLIHDPVTSAVGAIHAGWRGATDGIIVTALQAMANAFGTQFQNLQIYIGPHARTCCYQVDRPFYKNVIQKPWGTTTWHYDNNGELFFDLYHCCIEQLHALGITHHQIKDSSICTICTSAYCSYRRDKEHAGRNISIIGIV